jgi:hypothetical protein
MNRFKKLFILFLLLGAGCKDSDLEPDDNVKKGYLVVDCENCKIEYGMPDQYYVYNVNGNSGKLYFKQNSDYKLKTYITALRKEQTVNLSIYNNADKKVFSDTTTQTTTGMWETNVLVRSE